MLKTGKSAIINSLLQASTLTVYNPLSPKITAQPTTTPHPQSINISHKKTTLRFIDTPGLTFIPPPSTSDTSDSQPFRIAHDILLRNRGNISKVKDPLPAAMHIFHRSSVEDIMMLYNLPAVPEGDFEAFLGSLARKEGALHKRVSLLSPST